jgi:hypothetical protein
VAFLELDDIAVHLAVELGDAAVEAQLTSLIAAAARACEKHTGRRIDAADLPEGSLAAPFDAGELDMLRHAARLMIGDWFLNREAGDGGEVPLRLRWLLDPLRDFSDR